MARAAVVDGHASMLRSTGAQRHALSSPTTVLYPRKNKYKIYLFAAKTIKVLKEGAYSFSYPNHSHKSAVHCDTNGTIIECAVVRCLVLRRGRTGGGRKKTWKTIHFLFHTFALVVLATRWCRHTFALRTVSCLPRHTRDKRERQQRAPFFFPRENWFSGEQQWKNPIRR